MTAHPRTLSELAAAYYATLKTTIGDDEPLARLQHRAEKLPYFIGAGSVRYQEGQPVDRYFDFKVARSENPYEIGRALLDIKDRAHAEARKQGVTLVDNGFGDLMENPDGTIRIKFELRMGGSRSEFQSFTKGLGVLLRAATQHKREEAYNPAARPWNSDLSL
ncbi:MAG TPA: hypothetical protein PLO23_07700 [Alphaproteobacteria bacterium]|nr:hypothetical protein [Alphaproteobacteria bacterium]